MSLLSEYPRPQMVRDSYLNLNGIWNCTIFNSKKVKYKGNILVPYSPETKLSGVLQDVRYDDTLVYEKNIILRDSFNRGRVFLHFGAVDQICKLFINDKYVGKHIGGYTPFSFDITNYLIDNKVSIKLEVKDYTEKNELSRGKQSSKPKGIWYHAQSGIWKTVWLESVPHDYIESIKITPNIDNQSVSIYISSDIDDYCDIELNNAKYKARTNSIFEIKLDNPIYWDTNKPYLYDVIISLKEDIIKTYFGYRKIEIKNNEKNKPTLYLNNKPIIIKGILEQGYYKDGLYTPSSYDMFYKDIKLIKDCGFNTIRKHIKIESDLFYYYCDKLGMLVIQDMVNGGGKYNKLVIGLPLFVNIKLKDSLYFLFKRKNRDAKINFENEIDESLKVLYNHPSIIMWTIFNEGWGQYDSNRIYEKVKAIDNTRLIDSTSGWYDQGIGNLTSKHVYFKRYKHKKDKNNRAILISEFGGYSYGKFKSPYKRIKTENDYLVKLNELLEKDVKPYINDGLIGFIYTQYNDVENEQNGIVDENRVLKSDKLIDFFNIEE